MTVFKQVQLCPSLAQSSPKEVSAVLKLLYILTWVLVSWVFTCAIIYPADT